MKLLLDQNLSHRLLDTIGPLFPGSGHVRQLGLEDAGDEAIWEFARENDFAIVPKDSDFRQRSFFYGLPPKVVWIRCGNGSTRDIERVLIRHTETIRLFAEDKVQSFLILS